jgi:uncharacterized protein (TIGR03382 family)
MVIDMLVLGSSAFAGYGDARDGLPTHEDRETFFWTNAYRVEPDAFRDEVPCNYNGFASSEKTPKEPLLYNADLTDAAFYHSNDMRQDGYFDHDSNDGTSWDRRIHRYYSGGMIGENIAYGYSSPYDAVIRGWMCSSGHRANIMNAGYNELGAGVSGTYYTQDFGNRSSAPDRGMALGIHLPHEPGAEVAYYVDWSGGSAPDALYVVADGVRYDLDLELGTDTRGMWGATLPSGNGCQAYYFVAEHDGDVETFPENGSYGYGNCSWDDRDAEWLDSQIPLPEDEPEEDPTTPTDTGTEPPPGPGPGPDPEPTDTGASDDTQPDAAYVRLSSGCGCDAASPGAMTSAALLALALVRRRR